jgi:hypothetical protein
METDEEINGGKIIKIYDDIIKSYIYITVKNEGDDLE